MSVAVIDCFVEVAESAVICTGERYVWDMA